MIKITILSKRRKKGRPPAAGFALIELIIAITLLGFILSSLIQQFANISFLHVMPEYRSTQMMLARELVEEIRSRRFDEQTEKDVNGNWSTSMSVDTGENSATKATFDDVDDFHGYSEVLSGSFSGFTRTVTVAYVAAGALNTPLTIPGSVPNDWTPNYKKITVTVTHAAVAAVSMETLVTPLQGGGS